MPELPEIETLKRGLENFLTGRIITEVKLHRADLRYKLSETLPSEILATTIVALRRIAKYLIIELNNGYSIAVHLGMSGRLTIKGLNHKIQKHDHVIFVLDNNSLLVFNDVRRFGMIYTFPTAFPCQKIFGKLGPDPLSDNFNASYLKEKLSNRKASIKSALMDNTIVVGIGNIYASESLFQANINPARQSHSLAETELEKLVESIKNVLKKAILAGGTTFKDFVNSDNKPGYFKQELAVYARKGEKCIKCSNVIIRTKQCGRASFYCPNCQK